MVRKFLKFLIYMFSVFVILAVAFGVLVMQDSPLVEGAGAPTPDDVVEAREFVHGVRSALQSEGSQPAAFASNEGQLNSVMKLGARFIPGFRGQLQVTEAEINGFASIPIRYTQKWVNLRATVPEYEGKLALSGVRIGPISVPAAVALSFVRNAANSVFGENYGDRVIDAATSMRTEEGQVIFNLAMDEMGSNGLMRGLFGTLRGSDMPRSQDIGRYYLDIRKAMDRGELPTEGNYLPYLIYTLQAALEGSKTEGIENAYTSAIFALTLICGAKDFTLVMGGMVGSEFPENRNWKTDCGDLTLNGRIDSRRHFTTAAALQAASNRGFAVSVGEFKELYDTIKSGGFDFTDLAANNSGIRMTDTMMSTDRSDWPIRMARIRAESDVIVPFDGIPQILSGEEFRQAYKDVESPEYYAILGKIEAKIDELALHRH